MVVAGLKGVPHAGDMLRATSSESRARDIAEARAARAQARHHAALEKLSTDHFETVEDEATGTSKQYAHPSSAAPCVRATYVCAEDGTVHMM